MKPEAFRSWRKGLDRVTATAAGISALAVAALAVAIATSFVARALFGSSVPGLIEFSETLIVLAVFLGLAHGERVQSQIRMTLLTDHVSALVATVMRIVAMFLSLVLVIAFSIATSMAAVDSYLLGEVRFGLLRFPLWPARMLIAIGFWLLAIEYAAKLLRYALDLVHGEHATYDDGERVPYYDGNSGQATDASKKGQL